MGAGGVPNRGVEVSYERSLLPTGKPNTRVDKYKNGKRIQSRWYDKNGKAVRNRDYSHGGQYPFPHDHNWTWNGDKGERGKDHLPPNYENYK